MKGQKSHAKSTGTSSPYIRNQSFLFVCFLDGVSLTPRQYLTALGKVIHNPSEEVEALEVHLEQTLLLLGGCFRDLKEEGAGWSETWTLEMVSFELTPA